MIDDGTAIIVVTGMINKYRIKVLVSCEIGRGLNRSKIIGNCCYVDNLIIDNFTQKKNPIA